jgi:hypothetical protein
VALSANFTETDPVFAKIVCPVIPDGLVAAHQKVEELGGTSPAVVSDTDTTPDYQSFGTSYPECASGSCQLTLTSTGADSCFVTPGPCAGWFTDPDKATKFQCTYGTHVVALSQCNVYSPTFDPAKVATGTPYADPVTGTTNGVQSGATADSQTFGSTVQSPDSGRACFPTGWAVFNPVEWVMKPVQCAMQWSFIPRTSVMNADNESIRGSVGRSAVGGIQSTLSTWGVFGFADTGCSGVVFNFDLFVHVHSSLLAACPGDALAPAASLTKTIVSAVVISAGVLACLRYIAQIFGYSGLGSVLGTQRDHGGKVNEVGVKFK